MMLSGEMDLYRPSSSLSLGGESDTEEVRTVEQGTALSSYSDHPREAFEKGFQLVPKPLIEVGSFKLYHDTINKKRDTVFNAAKVAYVEGSYKLCLSYISKALYFDPDNVEYYALAGDAYLQMKDFKSAISHYKRVCILKPNNEDYFTKLSHIYYQYGDTYFDDKLYLKALECFTQASEMKPNNSKYHERIVICLASLNRHKECLSYIGIRLGVEPDNVNLLLFRSKLHMKFRNHTLTYLDIKETLNYDPTNLEAREMLKNLESMAESYREKAEKLYLDGKVKEALLKISQAISSNLSVTEYHVLRACMHRHNDDFNAAVDDLILAMDKVNHDPESRIFQDAQKQLLLTFNDFAVRCFHDGFYEEAIVLLEKAIKGEKQNKALYSNRGDCFLKLDNFHFALLDYEQAQELDPFDTGISLRLSIVFNELGIMYYKERNYSKAEHHFSLAISHHPRISTYYVSRAKARYMSEKLMETQVDVISALNLDRSNREVLPLFARLFPSKTIEDVLNGEFACLVIDALESELGDDGMKTKEKVSLSKTSPLPNIDARLCVDVKMKKCMEDQQFNFSIIKGRKKVNELVEAVIHSKQNLAHQGPSIANTRQEHLKTGKYVN